VATRQASHAARTQSGSRQERPARDAHERAKAMIRAMVRGGASAVFTRVAGAQVCARSVRVPHAPTR